MEMKRGLVFALLFLFACISFCAAAKQVPNVKLIRVPNGGIQPQVVVDHARVVVDMIYFQGDPAHGNIFYVRSKNWGATFSSPIRVNSQPGSAVAVGTIRGAHLAVGANGRVYVAWNGSTQASPKGPKSPEMPGNSPYNGMPMLFTRLNRSGTAFEPQRNLMESTFGLDGGGSVAADGHGDVYVAWHARKVGYPQGEAGRRVWIARSRDAGRDFSPETLAWAEPTGACGCCGLSIFAGENGTVYILYRTAKDMVHRNVYLLISRDDGRTFRGQLVDKWTIGACPMTSMAFAQGPGFVDAAWQTRKQVYYAMINPKTLQMSKPVPAPGVGKLRKYPALAVNSGGDTILVWTDGTSWGHGGSLGWQVFNRNGNPIGKEGHVSGVPAWSFGAVFARPDGGFTIVY
jgi:hypothetical protein